MNKEPLVSIVVITYNSASTVVETLESIRCQSYGNLELIVSDDCSSDNTVEVVEIWLQENRSRFKNTDLVRTKNNTGVSGNINRGIRMSHGEWIKSIAGDDLLIPTAVEEYVKFVKESSLEVRMCVSDVECFSTEGEVRQSVRNAYDYFFKCEQEPYKMQKRRICHESLFVGPTFFYSRELYDMIGGFMEEYGNCEEWPFVYKVLNNGYPIFAINRKLVKYRVSDFSLCHIKDKNGLSNRRLFEDTYSFFFNYPFGDLIRRHYYFTAWHYWLLYKSKMYRYRTNDSKLSRFIYDFFKYISPYAYLHKLGLLC